MVVFLLVSRVFILSILFCVVLYLMEVVFDELFLSILLIMVWFVVEVMGEKKSLCGVKKVLSLLCIMLGCIFI